MKLSEWLDEKESEHIDVSEITIPTDIAFDNIPDETIFFKEMNTCGVLCTGNHPFSKVERFGNWYYCTGQDKQAGMHSTEMKWHLFTKNKALALKTAKSRIE